MKKVVTFGFIAASLIVLGWSAYEVVTLQMELNKFERQKKEVDDIIKQAEKAGIL